MRRGQVMMPGLMFVPAGQVSRERNEKPQWVLHTAAQEVPGSWDAQD